MVKLVNRAKMAVASGGAGTLTLGAAPNGYQTFTDSGVSTGDYIRYTIEDGSNWEVGLGYYNATGPTLARSTIHESSNSGNAITCGSDAVIFVTMSAEDFTDNAAPDFANTIPSTLELTAGGVSTINAKALDDDGFPVSYSFDAHNGTTVYSASSLPPQLSSVSINQTTGVYSLTATSSASGAGNVNFRVRASDGVRTATKTTTCSLSFLPLNGLLGLYDMKDSNSYSGSGTVWSDVSGNSGPNFTLDLSLCTYTSSGTGGLPALKLDTITGSPPVYCHQTGLANVATPTNSTAVLIFAKREDYHSPPGGIQWFASNNNIQNKYFMMAMDRESAAFLAQENSASASIRHSTNAFGTWNTNGRSAWATSKLYIDKVDATSYNAGQVWDAISDTNNNGKYHSIALTDGQFLYGFGVSHIPNTLNDYMPSGDLRAMLFYNRVLTQADLNGLHAHFAADYTSATMVQ